MPSIVGTIQEIVRQEMRGLRLTELGLVEDVFPHGASGDDDNYGCDIRLKNSGLLLKRVPIATGHIGTVAIPNKDDLVLVAFDKGDVNQPILVGRLYNDKDRPPLNHPNEVIFRLPLAEDDDRTIKGAIRNIKENSPPREMLVEMAPKITLRVTDGTVQATAGKTELKLDQPEGTGGRVTVVAGRTTVTMNQDGDLAIESVGSMALKAGRDLSLEATSITIKAAQDVSVEAGFDATVKGGISATVQGSAASTVQGATVSIKGLTSFSP